MRPGGGQPGSVSWTLTIPAPCKLLNANDRLHWAPKAKLTRAWRMAAHIYARQARLPKGLDRVHVDAVIVKPAANRSDVGNYFPTVKAILDGLTDYGVWPDDNDRHVTGPDLRPGGKGPAAVTLKLTVDGA